MKLSPPLCRLKKERPILETPQLTASECRSRQQRLREALAELGADQACLVSPENVQWATGFRPHRLMQSAAVVSQQDGCTLIAPVDPPPHHAADEVRTFEPQRLCTLRQDQAAAVASTLPRLHGVTAIEGSHCGPLMRDAISGSIVDIEPRLWELRRRKHDDELSMMRHAIACTDAMYRKAREIIRPGIRELEVFNQLHAVAVDIAGEPLTALGNDYQSNSPGGPPRPRAARSGELMILDLGPAYRGYYADNCRTFAVDGNPSDAQLQARDIILGVFETVRSGVRPGASCRELFVECKAVLDAYRPESFFHHLGHGVGLYPHEAPHLNPNWDDTFEVGDVFTVEPGLYADDLRAGIRIEENFVVTEDGVEQLTSTPTEL